MRINRSHIAALLAAGAAAAAIATAPMAIAATAPSGCHMMGADPVCPNTHSTLISPSPGNGQIDASPGAVGFSPQYPYDEGGYWGGYDGFGGGYVGGFGGFGHGGGFGGGHGGGGGHGR
jgi:hypothetical protein